jgi:dsRNA-specific ribonuclease
LFETIIGAAAVDSNYYIGSITKAVDTMLDLNTFFDDESFYVDFDFNYIVLLQEWSQGLGYGLPNYKYTSTSNLHRCVVTITSNDKIVIKADGFGTSRSNARFAAAKKAYESLSNRNYVKNELEIMVNELTLGEATHQLNELH